MNEIRQHSLFEGQADARQGGDIVPNCEGPVYRALTGAELALHNSIKAKASEMEALFNQIKAGRYRSLGFTALEEAVMWAVKEITL
jgi:hypothetical protein